MSSLLSGNHFRGRAGRNGHIPEYPVATALGTIFIWEIFHNVGPTVWGRVHAGLANTTDNSCD